MELESLKVFELEKFDTVSIKDEVIEDLHIIIEQYMNNPRHIIFNFDLVSSSSDEYLDNINFLSTLLKSDNYSLQISTPPESINNKLMSHRYRNLPQVQDLANFVLGLDKIERELRKESLLKSYVDQSMKQIFSKSKLVIRRGELTIEDGPENFFHKVNYFQTFELEDAFFSFVIASSEEFFSTFLKYLNEKELAPIFNNIISNIPKNLISNVRIHDYLTHPYENFPTEKISINDTDHSYFNNCVVMKVPLECSIGVFNLEVWIPKKFAKKVYSFLNP